MSETVAEDGLRHMDTLTTEPDLGLECSLMLEAIKNSQESVEKLADDMSGWIQKRILFPDPGFHHLGTTIENYCNTVWVLLNQRKVQFTKCELYETDLPGKIGELERIHEIMQKRTLDMPEEEASVKKSKLESWFNEKRDALNDQVNMLQSETLSLDKEIDSVLLKCVSHIRAGDDHQSQAPDDELMMEVEKFFGASTTPSAADPQKLVTAPTLLLGEQSVEERLLPDNQEGDSQVMQSHEASMDVSQLEQPKDGAMDGKQPSVKRLIVPPGCDIPIKQTMVDIFKKSRETPHAEQVQASGNTGAEQIQDPSGTMQAPSCEETACKYIEQLPDGATKRALQSLAEASLAKVGNTVQYD